MINKYELKLKFLILLIIFICNNENVFSKPVPQKLILSQDLFLTEIDSYQSYELKWKDPWEWGGTYIIVDQDTISLITPRLEDECGTNLDSIVFYYTLQGGDDLQLLDKIEPDIDSSITFANNNIDSIFAMAFYSTPPCSARDTTPSIAFKINANPTPLPKLSTVINKINFFSENLYSNTHGHVNSFLRHINKEETSIYTINGMKIKILNFNRTENYSYARNLPNGIYFTRVNGKLVKIAIFR